MDSSLVNGTGRLGCTLDSGGRVKLKMSSLDGAIHRFVCVVARIECPQDCCGHMVGLTDDESMKQTTISPGCVEVRTKVFPPPSRPDPAFAQHSPTRVPIPVIHRPSDWTQKMQHQIKSRS